MQIRRSSKQKDAVPEPNLIPVLSCMFLMIPALLLAMEVAKLSGITVMPPRFTHTEQVEKEGADDKFVFTVVVRSDGFLAKVVRRGESEGGSTEIGVRDGEHDYAALEAVAERLKNHHPEHTHVNVTAEGDVRFDTIVRTIDALRGSGCSLRDPSDECLFWDVVVES